jgi:hypothetical protein
MGKRLLRRGKGESRLHIMPVSAVRMTSRPDRLKGLGIRDICIPYLHIDTIKVRSSDIHSPTRRRSLLGGPVTKDELLQLLTERKALIVHCSRPGKADGGIGGALFPGDLKNAIDICGNQKKELSCSLVWPAHTHTYGSVGIILKPRSDTSITSVSPIDSGTAYDTTIGRRTGSGAPFSRMAVEETFANARTYNEWTVADADTVGIFVNLTEKLVVAKVAPVTEILGYDSSIPYVGPIVVQHCLELADVIAAFPELRVYGFYGTEIIEIGIDASRFYS